MKRKLKISQNKKIPLVNTKPMKLRRKRPMFADLLDIMKKGDSFFLPNITKRSEKTCIAVSLVYYKKKYNKNYLTRSVDGGVRVWRIS